MRLITALFISIAITLCLGCDEPTASSSVTPSAPKASSAPKAPSAPKPPGDEPDEETEEDEYDRQVAEVGVGKKGRGYGGGVVTEPIRAMFRTEQRIQLMNMEGAMKMYKASNGFLPKTHEVFMKEIIEVNSIELPELPDGERYIYDPEQGELMVERPKKD